jgi:2,4-dienoyl-CoA reductase-like NADH-dependent reductase (Old Yellow Enzyme family)
VQAAHDDLAKHFMKYNLAPSAVPLYLGDTAIKGQPVRAMTVKDIRRVERQFAEAAERVKEAGADGVELHAAHGYLISEFFSPYTNRRTDEYGGSLENRTRFLREIIEQVRDKVGKDFPLLVRLNVDEFYRDIGIPGMGLELKEGVEIAKIVERCGADAIDVSCGTYETLNHLMEPTTYPWAGAPTWRKRSGKR